VHACSVNRTALQMDAILESVHQLESHVHVHVPKLVLAGLLAFSAVCVLRFVLRLLWAIYVYFIRPGKNLTRYGAWAVVTGSTDGIGKALAEQLARKGLNVVLISRTEAKLREQATTIAEKFKVQTKFAAVDFSKQSPTLLDPVKAIVKGLDVGILVNNVGVSYDHAEFFTDLDPERIESVVRVNVNGTTAMTQIVLPGMVERKRGAIVNISSMSSLVNEPLYAVYSGTKAYLNSFSQALYYENVRHGVHVQSSLPGFVATKLSKIRSTSLTVPSANAWARSAIAHIGYEPLSVPYWSHALLAWFVSVAPQSVVASAMLKNGLNIRRRALQKKKEQGKKD